MKKNGLNLVKEFSKKGKYFFLDSDAESFLKTSRVAVLATLRRLRASGEVATPIRGFHLIVPPEYQSLGCLPPDQFTDPLMKYLGLPYYICLLSAGQVYGAAHQQPQIYQVMVPKRRRAITCGRVGIRFYVRTDLDIVPTVSKQTRTWNILFSSPEATALDLVRYPHESAGWGNVATVLSELHEEMDPKKLVRLAPKMCTPTDIQRLGYILDRIARAKAFVQPLSKLVQKISHQYMPLIPGQSIQGSKMDKRWMLYVNETIESDL